MPKKILILEDDPGISLSIKDELEYEGYTVYQAEDAAQGFRTIEEKTPDLIILDIMLPDMDGYEICKRLRSEGTKTPIIMLTVRDKEIDRVLGLELGADDYISKPFSLRELLARIKAVLRRTNAKNDSLSSYSFGQIELDFKKYEAKKGEKKLDLTPLEFHMLKLFIQNRGEVITRDRFLDHIWGEDN
ncbi:MAG: response regulator transcription factor, partial [Candidatus Aminicenantes bacterium]|nr:response regulator transcription factor [Candidatus Aminicenantes bacterium]